jgi:hypothetical protein
MPSPAQPVRPRGLTWLRGCLERRFSIIVLIGAPFLVVAMVLLGATYNLYRYYLLAAPEMSLFDVAFRLAAISYNSPKVVLNSFLVMFDTEQVQAASPLPTLRLRVENGSLEKMAANLPHSAKAKYYPAWLQYPDGVERPISYRFRGRSRWHWMPEKPSLRLRLPKKAPLGMMRHINVVNPEDRLMMSNYIGDELARRFDLLSFDTRFVRLFINNRYFGVYHTTLREDETFLRKQRRVPGPMYVGDNIQDPWAPDGFETVGDMRLLDGFNPMRAMTDAMYGPAGPERYRDLWSVLSMQAYARWQAVMILTAGTHSDNFHNHLFYFDPRMGKLEPAVVDTNGHGMFHFMKGRKQLTQGYEPDPTIPLNEPREPLKDMALRDPRFYHLRNVILYDAINGEASVTAQHGILDDTFAMIDQDVHADHRKLGLGPTFAGAARLPYSNAQYEGEKTLLYDWITGRDRFIRDHLEKTEVTVRLSQDGGDVLLLSEIKGHSGVEFNVRALSAKVFADEKLDGSFTRSIKGKARLFPGLEENTGEPHKFVAVYPIPPHFLVPGTQKYLFKVKAVGVAQLADELQSVFSNAVTGGSIAPDVQSTANIDPRNIAYNKVSQHIWRFPAKRDGRITLGPAPVHLTRDLVIDNGQTLEILAGTKIQMGPGVSILSHGKVLISGTDAAPVKIKRDHSNKPWGSLVLKGPGADGSRLHHFVAGGGSIGKAGHSLVSGMIAIFGAKDIEISDVYLADNSLSDDLLHLVYTDYVISNVTLENCYADCIDIDYGRGRLANVRITNAGNDGIDFMTGIASLRDIEIAGAGDKGISAGEASQLDATNLAVSGAVQGLGIKDRSRFNLNGGRLAKNKTAIVISKKNWRYGGPGIFDGRAVQFTDNEVSLSVEKGGVVTLTGQPLPERRHGDGTMTSHD